MNTKILFAPLLLSSMLALAGCEDPAKNKDKAVTGAAQAVTASRNGKVRSTTARSAPPGARKGVTSAITSSRATMTARSTSTL